MSDSSSSFQRSRDSDETLKLSLDLFIVMKSPKEIYAAAQKGKKCEANLGAVLQQMYQKRNEPELVGVLELIEEVYWMVFNRHALGEAKPGSNFVAASLPLFKVFEKFEARMRNKDYSQAVETLVELERVRLETMMTQEFYFTEDIGNSLNLIQQKIKEETCKKFDELFVTVKEATEKIAKISGENIDDPDYVEKNARVDVNLTPIVNCWKVFNFLEAKEEFQNYYEKKRSEQRDAVVHQPLSNLNRVVEYVTEVKGFFIVEDEISTILPDLITKKNDCWNRALHHICDYIKHAFNHDSFAHVRREMKGLILLFTIRMASYEYDVAPLYAMLQEFVETYIIDIRFQYWEQFKKKLGYYNYTPITVSSEQEFLEIAQQFPFYKERMEKKKFPRTFPFSRFVIWAYTQAKQFVTECLTFMKDLQLSTSSVNKTIRNWVVHLFKLWAGELGRLARKIRSTAIIKQIFIDLSYLEMSYEPLDAFSINNPDGKSAFEQFVDKKHCFGLVYGDIGYGLAETIVPAGLAGYDWLLPVNTENESDFFAELTSSLRPVWEKLQQLPYDVARNAFTPTCDYIAQTIFNTLISPNIEAISAGALEQMRLNVCRLSCDAPSAGPFEVLKLLIQLVLTVDWSVFVYDYYPANGTYEGIKYFHAIALLQKQVEYERMNGAVYGRINNYTEEVIEILFKELNDLPNRNFMSEPTYKYLL